MRGISALKESSESISAQATAPVKRSKIRHATHCRTKPSSRLAAPAWRTVSEVGVLFTNFADFDG
jgi:hypothetical protein